MMSGQIESSTTVSSVMSLPDKPIMNGHNQESSASDNTMQDRGKPDDGSKQSDDSDEWVLIG
jgi:hypothetical protein